MTAEVNEEKPVNNTEVPEELQQMFKDLSTPVSTKAEESKNQTLTKVTTTENLISVLEDEPDTTKENPPIASKPVNEKDTTKENLIEKPPVTSTPNAKTNAPRPKKYLYKLKSKSGRILHYTSRTPIVLKKPIIRLDKLLDNEPTDSNVDSDASSKENNRENETPNESARKIAKKKGRPPLTSPRSAHVTSDDKNSSDTDAKKSTSSYGIQTRKRKLKFLPDGRLVTPDKKLIKLEENRKYSSSTSDSDNEEVDSDDDYSDSVERKLKKSDTSKKFGPFERKSNEKKGKYKKVFDYESYYREKTGGAVVDPVQEQNTPKISENKSKTNVDSSTKKTSHIDPAQLLTSLIGIPVTKGQLHIVKFKPKIIQQRAITTNSATTPKKVTFEDEKKKPSNASDLLRSTPFKIVSKPTYQKILPKPAPKATSTPMPPSVTTMITTSKLLKPIAPKPVLEDRKSLPSVSLYSPIIYKSPVKDPVQELISKFENFTDTKIVTTKEGPKNLLKGKLEQIESKTVYNLMQDVFDLMPSWNLHVIPDNNSFCIAQVSRGRMGIPILKKSIELNPEFFAKVYVHQLHCKRYDGVYDTENKILTLIKEIDALAA